VYRAESSGKFQVKSKSQYWISFLMTSVSLIASDSNRGIIRDPSCVVFLECAKLMASRRSLPSLEQASQASGYLPGSYDAFWSPLHLFPHLKVRRKAAKISNCDIGTSEIKPCSLFRGDIKIRLELGRWGGSSSTQLAREALPGYTKHYDWI
jgi:hypothetical protein